MRSAGNMNLVSCDNLWRNLTLKESLIPSVEKVSVFRIELQQERERLCIGAFVGQLRSPRKQWDRNGIFLANLFSARDL
jgi:hypothetical protein